DEPTGWNPVGDANARSHRSAESHDGCFTKQRGGTVGSGIGVPNGIPSRGLVLCRLRRMRPVALAGIALLCSEAVFAQSREEVRHHHAIDDSLTGARIGEMTVIVRDQVYRNGAIDVLFAANGVGGFYTHRTLDPAVVVDRYALRETG